VTKDEVIDRLVQTVATLKGMTADQVREAFGIHAG